MREHYRISRLPHGKVKVSCRRCYHVSRSGWRRPHGIFQQMRDVGPWVDAHECTPYRTLADAKSHAASLVETKDWLPRQWREDLAREAKHRVVADVEFLLKELVHGGRTPCARCGGQGDSGHARNSVRNEHYLEMIVLCASHGDPTEDDYRHPILTEQRLPDFATMTTQ